MSKSHTVEVKISTSITGYLQQGISKVRNLSALFGLGEDKRRKGKGKVWIKCISLVFLL